MWNQPLKFSPTFLGPNNLPNTSAFYHHICENLNAQSNAVWVLYIITQTMHVLHEPSARFYAWEQSNGEIRPLVTNEPVEFEEKPVQEFRQITDHSRIIYGIIKENRKNQHVTGQTWNTWISTGFVQNIPQKLLGGWYRGSRSEA